MKLNSFLLCCSIIIQSVVNIDAQSISSTYIGGTLGTKLNVYDNSCSGIITLQLPANDFYIVTGVDVSYSFRSVDPFPTSQQRSFLEFLNDGSAEPEVSGPAFQFQNPVPYSRTGLDIANGSYPGGTNLQFALRLKSEDLMDLSVTSCNSLRHYVEDASWTVTVHYSQGPKVGINTDTPEALLDVNGKIMISDDDYSAKEGMVKYDVGTKEFAGYNGIAWKSLSRSQAIEDLDGDTKIQLEDTPGSDEDEVTFSIGGVQKWRINQSRIEPLMSSGNLFVGEDIGGTSEGSDNTVYGNFALANNEGGVSNVAVGKESMFTNTSGYENVAVGNGSLLSNTIGIHNAAIGYQSLVFNTSGSRNVGIGQLALSSNTRGSDNIGIGASSLPNLVDGTGNIAVGYLAGDQLSGQDFNTVIGYKAMEGIFGSRNTIIGAQAGDIFGSGIVDSMVSIGYKAMSTSGTVAVGLQASGGFRSVAIGTESLTISSSVAIGRFAYAESESVGIGNFANYELLLGGFPPSKSVSIGNHSQAHDDGVSLGYNAYCFPGGIAIGKDVIAGFNQVVIGSSSVTSIGGPQAWTNLSDARYKKAVRRDVPGIDFIKRLQPVTYEMDIRKLSTENITIPDLAEAGKIRHTGFLAQDVEKAAQSLGYDFYGVDKPRERDGKYGLRYAIFVVPLVKAVQEQQEIIEHQTEKIKALEQELSKLKSQEASIHEIINRLDTLEDKNEKIKEREFVNKE